jgi:threonine dehydratase
VPATVVERAAAIREAADALRPVAPPTPLTRSDALSRRAGQPIWLKQEQTQPVGAFKVRGAWTAITRLDPAARARGLVTHSSGNHGQAVAWVAARLGLRAVVVMPETAAAVKVDAVRRHGAEVVFVEPVSTARVARADALARERGLTLIPPFDHEDVILGQATCAWEILRREPAVRTLLVPVGGGGLLAGTALAVRALGGSVRVVGVEPEGAPKLSAALAAGHPVALDEARSIADGLLPLSLGRVTFPYIQAVVREAARVSDADIARAMRLLRDEEGLRIEPSGAVGVAALLAGAVTLSTPAAIVLTGGNVDDARYRELTA